MSDTHILQITKFWLADSESDPSAADGRRDWWYRGGATVDGEIRQRFGELVERAIDDAFADWERTPSGSLALILLLDQFTRNLYRHTPAAYAGDARAFEVVSRAIEMGLDSDMHPVSRIWLYHPFHHSESVALQDRGLASLNELHREAPSSWGAYITRSIEGWTRHRNIVAEYGRFPHRNAVLGRVSSAAEERYLEGKPDAFGQGSAG